MFGWMSEIRLVEVVGLSQEKAEYRLINPISEPIVQARQKWNDVISVYCSRCRCFLLQLGVHSNFPQTSFKPTEMPTQVKQVTKGGITIKGKDVVIWCSECKQRIGAVHAYEPQVINLIPGATTHESFQVVEPVQTQTQGEDEYYLSPFRVNNIEKMQSLFEKMLYWRTCRDRNLQSIMRAQVETFSEELSNLEMFNEILTEEKSAIGGASKQNTSPLNLRKTGGAKQIR